MLRALDADPTHCGYSPDQVTRALKSLEQKKVKQLGMDAAYLYHLLLTKDLIARNAHTEKLAKPFNFIMKLRFDQQRSNLRDMPADIRRELLSIFLEYAEGSVELSNRRWEPIDLLTNAKLTQPYVFESPQQ